MNKKHCSVTCSRRHDKETRQKKWREEQQQQQQTVVAKVNWKPTSEVLKATEALLLVTATFGEGKTFHGVHDGEVLFTPQDATKIMWSESQMPDEKGVWSMVYVG